LTDASMTTGTISAGAAGAITIPNFGTPGE
jgi:hypothetical protein